MKKLIIIGFGGHGRECADVARENGYADISFLDDEKNSESVIGKVSDFIKYKWKADFFVAIGDNKVRKELLEKLNQNGCKIISLISKFSYIGSNVGIEKGTVIMPGAIINCGAKIGFGCIVNTSASIDHDCIMGEYSHLAVGGHLAGTVKIGRDCFLGAGATVINNISICDDVTIGAGATVIKNIDQSGTYAGVPARLL